MVYLKYNIALHIGFWRKVGMVNNVFCGRMNYKDKKRKHFERLILISSVNSNKSRFFLLKYIY